MLAYKADTAWNRGIPCIFFKILIQLYLLRSFLYSLTYCIKEVINGNILWRLNEKVLAYAAATAWNRGIPCKVSIYWSNCICFVYLSILDLLYQRGYQRQYFWTLNEKSVGLWGSYGMKQGNTLQLFKNTYPIVFVLFISLFFTYCIKEGIKGNIFGHYI